MLKAGIYLDMENLNRNGGYGIRYRAVRALAEAQGAVVLRINAYMAIDIEREGKDFELKSRKDGFRDRVRREGVHLVLKEVQRYRDADGEVVTKANSDLDLAVDALLQAENLDYILLGSGDGDFIELVRALQNRGKRVDLLSFSNTSSALRRQVDHHYNGYLVPGILPGEKDSNRLRGIMHGVNEEKGFGFITVQTGLAPDDVREDIFLHIRDFRGPTGLTVSNEQFGKLKTRHSMIEFDLAESEDGRFKAINAIEFVPQSS